MKKPGIGALGSLVLMALSVGLVGCSGDKTTGPAAPSAAPTSVSAVAGAMVTASHHGGGDNNSGPSTEVEIDGPAQAVTGACPTLHLTIAGRSVSTTASTEFKGVTCAGLGVGQMVEARGTLQSDGSVVATRIQVEGAENDPNNEAEVRGTISAETGACPTLTLTLVTTTVHTTAATAFHDGACSALPVGTMIEAKGTRQSDGSLLASTIERTGEDD